VVVVVRSGVEDGSRGVNGGRVMVNGAGKDDATPRRAMPLSTAAAASAINYPDNQQVFVGNLPQHLTDQDLIQFFEREWVLITSVGPGRDPWEPWNKPTSFPGQASYKLTDLE